MKVFIVLVSYRHDNESHGKYIDEVYSSKELAQSRIELLREQHKPVLPTKEECDRLCANAYSYEEYSLHLSYLDPEYSYEIIEKELINNL